MRHALLLAAPFALAACAGHLADYVGPRSSIVTPQLIRYGFDLEQTRCTGERLGAGLRPKALRLFVRAAAAVEQGYYEPVRLTPRDLMWVATSRGDPTRAAFAAATAACGVRTEAPPPPVVQVAVPAPRQSAWLNLGAAPTGQSIAVDASTIAQQETTRSAWFRLTDPGRPPSADIFHLELDCRARTINPTERRRLNAEGGIVESRRYEDNPGPVENGTVMEIAFLSLCT